VFQVREFKVEDLSPYPIKLTYTDPNKEHHEMSAFGSYTPIPAARMITFNRREAFEMEAHYSDASMLPAGASTWIGHYTINNVKPTPAGEPMTVKIKLRMNSDGLLDISSAASLEERVVENEATPMETDVAASEEDVKMTESENVPPAEATADGTEKKKKVVMDKKTLPVVGGTASLPKDRVQKLRELENDMMAADKLVIDTEERRNTLEEYVYEMRGKLEGPYADYVLEKVSIVIDNICC
jgi:heat shock protein 4